MKDSYTFLVLCVLSNFFVQILFEKVSKSIRGIEINSDNIVKILTILVNNPNFWLAIIIFVFSAIFWLIGIKKVPLSNAFAITSFNYIFVTVYTVIFLKEILSVQKVISISLVILGVYLMIIGSKNKSIKIKTF